MTTLIAIMIVPKIPIFGGVCFLIFLVFFVVLVVLLVSALCLEYPILPVSMDCPFWIAPSVFSNVYLK